MLELGVSVEQSFAFYGDLGGSSAAPILCCKLAKLFASKSTKDAIRYYTKAKILWTKLCGPKHTTVQEITALVAQLKEKADTIKQLERN